ncbi:MAG: hypothetical protein M0Q91_11010 [Methanoregula sp.]|nr:hypothetical protein [Methanoregula sp.]
MKTTMSELIDNTKQVQLTVSEMDYRRREINKEHNRKVPTESWSDITTKKCGD